MLKNESGEYLLLGNCISNLISNLSTTSALTFVTVALTTSTLGWFAALGAALALLTAVSAALFWLLNLWLRVHLMA